VNFEGILQSDGYGAYDHIGSQTYRITSLGPNNAFFLTTLKAVDTLVGRTPHHCRTATRFIDGLGADKNPSGSATRSSGSH
jgi:hypothetical protein